MAGFGTGPFGSGPFGRFDWSKQVLFRDMPEIDRRLDAGEDGRLETWIDVVRGSFDELLILADDFEQLRDPDSIRTRFQDNVAVVLNTAGTLTGGRLIEVFLDDPTPADPFIPLGRTSVGWILTDSSGREFTVNSVHKLDDAGPRLTLQGRAILPSTEADGAGLGVATIRPPALIDLLGADYGVNVDKHEPEAFQRSSVRSACAWYVLKGTERAYDIIGKIAGYRVTPFALWRVEGGTGFIPGGNLFELPAASGQFYTDLEPRQARFDEVAADVIPLDLYCWETPTWSADFPGGPPLPLPPDGTSVEDAIGFSLNPATIATATLTDPVNNTWTLTTTVDDLTIIVGIGSWRIAFASDPTTFYFVESAPVEGPAGTWTFDVTSADTLVPGAADFSYLCPINRDSCGICKASVIRVEVVPVEVLTDPEANLENALPRIVAKILQVVPIHVRLVDLVHIVGPVQATIGLTAQVAETAAQVAIAASVGYYYDIVPADEIEVDPAHLVATATSFTIP